MRQIGWLKRGIIRTCASWQHWSTTLIGISVFSTLVATLLLVFDGWIDALAIYLVSGLILTTMLSQLAGRQATLHAVGSVSDAVHNPNAPQPGLVFKQPPRVRLNRLYHGPGSNKVASIAVLSNRIPRE